MWLAVMNEGASVAFTRVVVSWWGDFASDEIVKPLCGLFGEGAEGVIEKDGGAAFAFAVEEVSRWDLYGEHFFEAESLGADLHLIGAVGFWFSALVFDGEHLTTAVEFNNVAEPRNAEGLRRDRKSAGDSDPGTSLVDDRIGFLVNDLPLSSEAVLRPELLQMDERGLSLTKEKVLKGGEREEG